MREIISIYDKNESDFTHNGIKILKPLEALVTEELNGDYSLKVTMPKGNKEIQTEQIISAPTPKGNQLFRVYNSDIDMLGNQVFYARHIFYDLLDYFIEDTRPSGSGALAISKILENTPFRGTSDITKQDTAYYQMINPVKAILGAENSFINVWGGELERDNFTVRMKNHIGENRGVSIRYRKNLTGLRLQTDLSGVYTKIMPTGLKADGQTLLKLPEKYVSSPLIDNYVNVKTTRIHYSDIKVDEEITEEQALEALRTVANLEFENGLDKPQITATVEFIPLVDTEEYKDLAVLEMVYLGDTVYIFHEDLDIELSSKVISYEFNALSKRYNKVALGTANIKYGDIQKQYIQEKETKLSTKIEESKVETLSQISESYYNKTNVDGLLQPISSNINEINQYIDLQDEKKAIVLQNSWLNYENGYETACYFKDKSDMVHISGVIKSGIVTSGTVIGSLPIGYRPTKTERFIVANNDGTCGINVNADGNISINSEADNTYLSLSGITFRAYF